MEAVVVNTSTDGARAPSSVAWGAVVAGGIAAAAAMVVLAALGAGLGLTAVSPWWNSGASPQALGVWVLVWLVVMQWISAALGGYLTGRLRFRWALLYDEVLFR